MEGLSENFRYLENAGLDPNNPTGEEAISEAPVVDPIETDRTNEGDRGVARENLPIGKGQNNLEGEPNG